MMTRGGRMRRRENRIGVHNDGEEDSIIEYSGSVTPVGCALLNIACAALSLIGYKSNADFANE